MYPNLCRVYMIPSVSTATGQEWARGRIDSLSRLTSHLIECTAVTTEVRQSHLMGIGPQGDQLAQFFSARRTEHRVEGLRFTLDPDRIQSSVLRQTRTTERGVSRRVQKAISTDEWKFFDLIEELTMLFSAEIAQLRDTQDQPLYRQYGWALTSGSRVTFMGGTTLPQFFGLQAIGALRMAAALSKEEVPAQVTYENDAVDEQLGAGIVTALRTYLGREKLGSHRADLVPHHLHEVTGTHDDGQPSRVLRIGQLSIDPV